MPHMRGVIHGAIGCAIALCIAGPLAAPSSQATSQQPAAQLPKGLAPDLGRPSKETDAVPLFDFDKYFLGRWTFEADAPDSALGPGGLSSGTVTYRKIDDGFYEAATEGKGE